MKERFMKPYLPLHPTYIEVYATVSHSPILSTREFDRAPRLALGSAGNATGNLELV